MLSHQQADRERVKRHIKKMRGSISSRKKLRERIEALEDDLDALNLVNLVLLSVLIENNVLTKEDFLARMKKLDMLDEIEDGKVTPDAVRKALESIWPE
jgi:hypothetical protein